MPALVTHQEPFRPCNQQQDHLFAVRTGVPLKDAIDMASCILETARSAVIHATARHDDELLHGAIFQLDAVKAVLDSANRALVDLNAPCPAVALRSGGLNASQGENPQGFN